MRPMVEKVLLTAARALDRAFPKQRFAELNGVIEAQRGELTALRLEVLQRPAAPHHAAAEQYIASLEDLLARALREIKTRAAVDIRVDAERARAEYTHARPDHGTGDQHR